MAEVTIRALTHKGDGVADGPIYLPQTLPGEVVTGEPADQTLLNPKITAPSPDRVKPPCRHFKTCGGCSLQHASDALVAAWKQDHVRGLLAEQGLAAEFLPGHVSPAMSRRRGTLAARRTKKGAMAGFHARASDVIVEIPDCRLLHPDLTAARPVAEDLAMAGASRKAALSVALTLSEAGLDVAVEGGKPLDGPLRMQLAQLAQTHDLARLSWAGEPVVTRRTPVQRFGVARVLPPPGAFLQATAEGEAAILRDVARITAGATRIVDIFAGCGTFALPLAARARVHAVEGDAGMVAALDQGWRRAQGLHDVSVEARDLFRRPLEADELSAFDAAVYDPPRARAGAQVARLAASAIGRIAYVSCNPASFARDARILVDAGFALGSVRVIDQFRWSPHVELVAGFTR